MYSHRKEGAYARMIKLGSSTLEQVPELWRADVEKALEEA